ncbi:MAG: MarR family transcriptional regulator [Firmicutes bacterium]|nr:MarR family transcriptional regulator [Bacillota bacterium]
MAGNPERLVDLLQEVARGLHEEVREVVQGSGLPYSSLVIARAMKEHPEITLSDLARRTGLAKSHVSRTIDELVRRGYVEKRPDPRDQRRVRLTLTEGAHGHFRALREAVRRRLAEVVATVPEEQLGALVTGLQILQSALERARSRRGESGDRGHSG